MGYTCISTGQHSRLTSGTFCVASGNLWISGGNCLLLDGVSLNTSGRLPIGMKFGLPSWGRLVAFSWAAADTVMPSDCAMMSGDTVASQLLMLKELISSNAPSS